MNTRFFTGYLPADAEQYFAPATAERAAEPRLVFDVMLRDSRGVEFVEKCLIDEPRRIREYQPLLTAGRAIIVEGEQTARPYHDRGVLKGYVREVRVWKIEFPNRGGKKDANQPEPAPAEAAS